jgi:small redox-active disulfide protein 2
MPFYNSNDEEDLKIKVKGEYEMKIEVLGMGCANCNKLYQNALEAVKVSGKEVEVAKVEDIKKIMSYGVMSTPALVIDGMVKVAGKVPKVEEIKGWIK